MVGFLVREIMAENHQRVVKESGTQVTRLSYVLEICVGS